MKTYNRHIKKPSKHIIIEKLEEAHGLVKPAARALKVTRQTLYNWIDKDKDLQDVQTQAREALLDLVESQLFKKIEEGDLTSIIFALKTIGKSRGYVERYEKGKISDNKIEVVISDEIKAWL